MDQLKEIPLPQPISWMPQTPAWYVLAGLLVLLLAWLIVKLFRVDLAQARGEG